MIPMQQRARPSVIIPGAGDVARYSGPGCEERGVVHVRQEQQMLAAVMGGGGMAADLTPTDLGGWGTNVGGIYGASYITASGASTTTEVVLSTTGKSSGKWWFALGPINATGECNIGVASATPTAGQPLGYDATAYAFRCADGYKINSNTAASYGTAVTSWYNLTVSDWSTPKYIITAVDVDAGKVWLGGTLQAGGSSAPAITWPSSGNPSTGANATYTGLSGTIKRAISIKPSTNTGTCPVRLINVFCLVDSSLSGFTFWHD